MSDLYKSTQSPYSGTSNKNALDFTINQKLKEINTAFIARVDKCSSAGSAQGSKTVNATPLIAQNDGQGNILKMTSVPNLPHYRIQQGIGALIIDPVQGDIGVFISNKNDISTLNVNTKEPQRAGSIREFNQSDSVMIGSIHTQKPLVWVEIKQDKTVTIHAPEGALIETDKNCTINTGVNCVINANNNCIINCKTANITATTALNVKAPLSTFSGNVAIKGTLTANNGTLSVSGATMSMNGTIKASTDMIGGGISLKSHVHSGVQAGGGDTGAPK